MPPSGPGSPSASFPADELEQVCAYLDGGSVRFRDRPQYPELEDPDHHNTVQMVDGYLVMPWAPEWGNGGIAVFDVSEPCAPRTVSVTDAFGMRETHAAGFASMNGTRFMAVAHTSGLQFWDVSDVTKPRNVHWDDPNVIVLDDGPISGFVIDEDGFLPYDVRYTDAYTFVVMSLFFQAPWVYVAASDNGLYVVDASNPVTPKVVHHHRFDPPLRAGGVFAVGNLLMVTAAEGSRTALLDISDPQRPTPIPGGTFDIESSNGMRREAYHSHLNGNLALYAVKDGGGGLLLYDISDPTAPRFSGEHVAMGGGGGYVFVKDDLAFVGESAFGEVIDISDPTKPRLVTSVELTSKAGVVRPGDFDTLTPLGNLMIGSSDDADDVAGQEATDLDGQASQVFPLHSDPDTRGPTVTMVNPPDGATGIAATSRIGLTFSEFVELSSLWRGSIQVRAIGCLAPLQGTFSTQEGIVNFTPREPLAAGTEYEIVVPVGGVSDYDGNPVETEFRATFTTAAGG